MNVTLSALALSMSFPAGTVDAPFSYTVTGTLADGVTPFTLTQSSGSFSLQPGTYTGVVSKTVAGTTYSSLASPTLTVAAPTTVSLMVPDGTKAATLG